MLKAHAAGGRHHFDTWPLFESLGILCRCCFPFVDSAAANVFSFPATESHPFLASPLLSSKIITDSILSQFFCKNTVAAKTPLIP